MSIGAKIGIGFACGLFLSIAVGMTAYLSTQDLLKAERHVNHAHEVHERLDDVLAQHLNAETGQRGYVITGEQRYLEPYTMAIARIRDDIVAVAVLVNDNPDQRQSLADIEKLSKAKLDELKETIELRRNSGLQAAQAVILSDRGLKTMNALRQDVADMESREEALLSKQTASADASARRTVWAVGLWMPLGLLALALLAVVLLRTASFDGPGPALDYGPRTWAAAAMRYAAAPAAVAAAVWLHRWMENWFGAMPQFILLFPAIMLISIGCGGGPGILATLLAAAAAKWVISPAVFFRIDAPNNLAALSIFTGAGLMLSIFAERLRRFRWAEALSVAQHQRAEELAQKNEVLAQQGEELSQQAEELSQQTEELSQQTEELSQQNEEMHAQAEEIRALNEELGHREQLLETFIEAARLGSEEAAMQKVCEAALVAFGGAADAALVSEQMEDKLVVRAVAGVKGREPAPDTLPLEHTFVELVMSQKRVACLNDVALRPDFYIFRLPGHDPFQAELCAPMLRGGKPFGAVAIYSGRKQQWTEKQFRLAEWLAAQCAKALETMRVQQALRESEDRFRSMVDAIPQMAWVARPDGWITWYNRRWYEYTGTTPEQMEGWGWESVQDPAILPAVRERWRHSLSSGEPLDMVFPLRGADGAYRPFLTRVVPLKDAHGRVLQWFGTNTDFSAQKTVEEQLEAAKIGAEHAKAAAEEANQAKDRFLAVLSHELRTPLTPVVMGLSILREAQNLSPAERETLSMIGRNIAMEARLIDDLLDVMRITQGKIEMRRGTIALDTVITRAVEVCKSEIEAKGIDFRADLESEAPYWVDGDPARLQQVFWNLLNNAAKFTPQGGCVVVRARRDAGHVVVEVVDTGIGIEHEALARIFDAFEQGERSITRRFGGMGLGLTISRAMLEMNGGTIEALSEGRYQGTTFRVRLPLVAPPSQPQPQPAAFAAPTRRPGRQLRILLVEDHSATAHMLRMVLTTDGHSVEVAGDLAMALELADKHPFDLLVSDVGLPDGSGHDLLLELRRRGRDLPAVALSGFGQQEDVERSYETGFAAHLTKPASREALLTAVNSVAAGDAAPSLCGVTRMNSPAVAAAFNPAEALAICLGQEDLLDEMIQVYLGDAARLLPEIEAAARRGDLAEMQQIAHRLKGTMLHLAADAGCKAADRVEQITDADHAEEAVTLFVEQCATLTQALTEYRTPAAPDGAQA